MGVLIFSRASMKHLKVWTKMFKALANENRLKILYWLDREGELSVKAVSEKIGRGIKITSKHLNILSRIDFLESNGKLGSVWYSINPDMRREIKHIVAHFLRK